MAKKTLSQFTDIDLLLEIKAREKTRERNHLRSKKIRKLNTEIELLEERIRDCKKEIEKNLELMRKDGLPYET